jgi:Mn-dependent DtxR family transcriptional regulator
MRSKESSEMYLEVILKLEKRNGIVRSIDIAREFDYSKPSVSRAVGVLKKEGYLTHSPYGDIALTDKGREKAESILKKHRLITDFLKNTLSIDAELAEQDACRIEHVISEETSIAIEEFLEDKK